MRNPLRIIFFLYFFSSFLWCCDIGFVEIEEDCYFQKDLKFLQALINNSQFKSIAPPADLNPIELGWQTWVNGRLVEFCSSTSTNTECRMEYELSGKIPLEIGNLTELKKISLESNKLIGVIPREIGALHKLEELTLSSNQLSGSVPSEIGNLIYLTKFCLLYTSDAADE